MILHQNHQQKHVECPERLMAIYFHLYRTHLLDSLLRLDSSPAQAADIRLVHSQLLLDKVTQTKNIDRKSN